MCCFAPLLPLQFGSKDIIIFHDARKKLTQKIHFFPNIAFLRCFAYPSLVLITYYVSFFCRGCFSLNTSSLWANNVVETFMHSIKTVLETSVERKKTQKL
jgi:hypothetical protein